MSGWINNLGEMNIFTLKKTADIFLLCSLSHTHQLTFSHNQYLQLSITRLRFKSARRLAHSSFPFSNFIL